MHQARRLKGIGPGDQKAEKNPNQSALPALGAPPAGQGKRKQGQTADGETNREEGEERIDGDRVLDLDEGDTPDNGDENQR